MSKSTEEDNPIVRFFEIDKDDEDIRLDRWLRRRLPDIKYGQLAKWLRTGQIRVDGHRAKPGQRLIQGQTVRLPPIKLPSRDSHSLKNAPNSYRTSSVDAKNLRDMILFRDNSIIAINKPSGLAVQGGSKTLRHLDGMLDVLRFTALERPRLVHRLDKDTSGVLLLARNNNAARNLITQFRQQTMTKHYWALVVGVPFPSSGIIELPLLKLAGQGGEKMRPSPELGKTATTQYSIVANAGQSISWLKLIPRTGRTHQLRAHCKALGTPIVGDGKYGGKESYIEGLPKKLHLHARSITFFHPINGKRIEIVAPLKNQCSESWKILDFDTSKA